MTKIYFQGTFGAYSHLAAISIDPKAEILPCKTFDECFNKASEEPESKIIIPESNRITGNIGIEYLIFKHRLNIYKEHFQKIEHNLLGQPGVKLKDIKNLKNENIVKVITENSLEGDHFPKAVSFSRKSEQVDNIYHHIGIYCYSRDCLEKFVHLDQSKNEIENRLEQLRALDNNIDINVSLAKSSPIGVDTEEDYLALKKIMEYKN